MKTYTTKTAKNGATLYYSVETGKRIAKETALENERKEIAANGTVAERYELAKETFRVNRYGSMEKFGWHDTLGSYVGGYAHYVSRKEWYKQSDSSANIDLQRAFNLTVSEFKAAALADKGFTAEQISQLLALKVSDDVQIALTFSKMCEAFEAENNAAAEIELANTAEVNTDDTADTVETVSENNVEVTDSKEETKMTNQTQNAVSTPATEIQAGTININASAVGNGRVVVRVYGNHECAPAKLDDIAAEMPRLSDINIIASDRRNFNAKVASYNGRYYAKANVYIFTNTSYGTADAKKMYKFDTAKEAVRKLARQELDDKIITAEELEIVLAADREIERQREAELERERAEAAERQAIWYAAKFYAAKIAVESKSIDDNFRLAIYNFVGAKVQYALAESHDDDNCNVFDMLPTVDELNDVEIEVAADEVKAELAEVEASLQELQTALEIEVCEGNDDNAQVIAERIVDLNARYAHLHEQIYGRTVEVFTDPAQVIANAIEITTVTDEEQREVFNETLADLKAKYDASDDEDERVEICVDAYRNYIEPKVKQQEREIADAVADTMNAEAPAGWKITHTKAGNFQILHGGNVEFVDTITAGDYLNPKEFFDRFRQTRAGEDDEREADLQQMKCERDQLIEMRDELADKFPDDLKRLRTLNEMIDEYEDGITAIENLLKRPPKKAVDFDKDGNVTQVWF